MTVAQLQELLSHYPDDQRVVVSGYEGGYDEPRISTAKLHDKYGPEREEWWWGRYDDDPEEGDETFPAVVIGR